MTTDQSATVDHFRTLLPQVGQRIREARQARGMTQTELCEYLGVSSKTISALEVGRVEASICQIQSLAAALNQPIGYFVGEENPSVAAKLERVVDELSQVKRLIKKSKV